MFRLSMMVTVIIASLVLAHFATRIRNQSRGETAQLSLLTVAAVTMGFLLIELPHSIP